MKRIYLWILLLFACVNVFAQSNMVQCEYWLDNDYASKMQTDLSPAQTVNWQTTVPCQNLDVGFHAFCARFMDSKGLWSSTVSSFFYKFPVPKGGNTMTAYEYWVDNETGTTQAFNPATPYTFSQNIEMKSLPAGFHAIHVRFLDGKGLWSPTVSSLFYKFPAPKSNNTIVAYEYWFNDDYVNKSSVEITPQQTFVLLDNVNFPFVNTIANTISYRFLDSSGLWSSTLTVDVTAMEQVEEPTASIPSGSTVEINTEVSLLSATEDATIYYTTDGSTPDYSTGLEYTQPIVLTKDVTIQAIAVKDNMLDSDIAVFEYKVTVTQTGMEQPSRAVSLFVKNQTLFVRGLEPGEQYAVHSVLGYVVVQGKVTNEVEQQIPLPSKGIFIFSTSKIKAKILVK